MNHSLIVDLPAWALDLAQSKRIYVDDDERMGLAIELSRQNVERGEGGPFGAAVFEEASGRVVAVGVNSVRRLTNCTAHAEMVALMFAGREWNNSAHPPDDGRTFVLATSCEPCAMCLGAVLWSGVQRIVCGATRADATSIGFDEGPVFTESWDYIARRGVHPTYEVRREEARSVLLRYLELSGPIYNG